MRKHDQANLESDEPSRAAKKIPARGTFICALLSFAVIGCFFCFTSFTHGENFCIDYHYYPNTSNLRISDFSILSPYCQVNLSEAHTAGKKACAYISAGETAANAQYYQDAQTAGIPFVGQNLNWNSMVVDLASSRWAPFVIPQLALPAINQGYDGFFLDTMESY